MEFSNLFKEEVEEDERNNKRKEMIEMYSGFYECMFSKTCGPWKAKIDASHKQYAGILRSFFLTKLQSSVSISITFIYCTYLNSTQKGAPIRSSYTFFILILHVHYSQLELSLISEQERSDTSKTTVR